jgi:DNA ligase D-like protein (predicted 3'-phosphoesterase)
MSPSRTVKSGEAIRGVVRGEVVGVGFRDATVSRARELGVMGWVRHGERVAPIEADGAAAIEADRTAAIEADRKAAVEADRTAAVEADRTAAVEADGAAPRRATGVIEVHAEGDASAVGGLVEFLRDGPAGARVDTVEVERVAVEGHEQFAIRGVSHGVFVVQEHAATAHHFDLRLEVDGVMRSWALPRGPSMDPAVKRMAIEVGDHALEHNAFEGALGGGGVIVWDRGTYEQGGRVPLPQALDRGHAVFVLRGEKLDGGFALQRTRRGEKPQWLLIKRRDPSARPGSDIVGEQPRSVISGLTLDELA